VVNGTCFFIALGFSPIGASQKYLSSMYGSLLRLTLMPSIAAVFSLTKFPLTDGFFNVHRALRIALRRGLCQLFGAFSHTSGRLLLAVSSSICRFFPGLGVGGRKRTHQIADG